MALAIAPAGTFVSAQGSLAALDLNRTPTPPLASDAIHERNTRKRTCYAFSYMPDEDPEIKYYNRKTGALEWRCRYCHKKYALNRGTRILKSYLRALYGITDKSSREITTQKRQLLLEESIAIAD